MSILSDFILIMISLVGLSFIVSGMPKKTEKKVLYRNNTPFYYKEPNLTYKAIKALIFLAILYFLGSSV